MVVEVGLTRGCISTGEDRLGMAEFGRCEWHDSLVCELTMEE
jgi:hypothetical protein